MLFNKDAYILTKRALSSSLSQCDVARPASEQYRATAHSKVSCASLAGSSTGQTAKTAMSIPESMGNYSGNLALATRCDKARVYPAIQTQTTAFQWRVAVSNIASKCAGSETRGMQSARKRSDKVPPSERESGFYSRYFVIPKRDGGIRPILDLRPINRALGKRPFRMLTLKQILAQIRPGDWFASVDLKDAYFHIQIAPHHRLVSEVCFRGHSVPILCSPVWASFSPTHLFNVHGCSSFPPQIEWGAHPQLFGRLADFSSVPGHAYQPHRLAAYSLGVPKTMCQHAEEHSNPESVHHISGSVLRLRGKESPPLARARGGYFVCPAPFQTRQLCSVEENSEAARTHGGGVSGVSSGITTHETATAMAKNSSPVDSVDIGMFEHHCIPRLHRSSETVAQPRPLQPGSPPGLGSVLRGGHDGCIDPRLESSVRWNASVGTVVETSEPVAHKPPGAGSSLLSSKVIPAAARTATCTDSHRQYVCGVVYKSPGRNSLQGAVQAGDGYPAMGGLQPSLRATHIPGLLNWRADMLSRKGMPQGEWRSHPESVRMIWNRYGRAVAVPAKIGLRA